MERRRNLDAAVTIWAAFVGEMGLYYTALLAIPSVLVGAALTFIHVPPYVAYAMLVVVPLAVAIYARIAVPRARVREQRWLASLPFRVSGYERCLGDYYRDNESSMTLTFMFAGAPPAGDRLREILAADGVPWKVDGSTAKRDTGPGYGGDNRAVRRWFHRLVEQQLLPLHNVHPISMLDVSNS